MNRIPEGLRVLRVLTRPNLGGPTRQVAALWHEHRAMGMRPLLAVGVCEEGETAVDLDRTGIPRLTWREVMARGRGACGLVEVPALRRGPNPVRDFEAARGLRSLCGAFEPHVVHTHTSKAGWLGRRAASRMRVPVVAHTYHGHVLHDYFSRPAELVLRRVEAALARQTDLKFAVSPSCAKELGALGLGDIQVVPPAVDLGAFAAGERDAARAALSAPPGARLVGFVGRLVPVKRPEVFAETMRLLPEARGVVFGEGPLRAQVEQVAVGNVALRGATEALPRYLSAFDVMVLPSRREGCPLAAVEAFAAGVPVVGFDVPGVRDALGSWGAGVLVPPSAGAVGLAAAVRDLLVDAGRRAELVRRARAGLSRFRPARVARTLADAYVEALEAARLRHAG